MKCWQVRSPKPPLLNKGKELGNIFRIRHFFLSRQNFISSLFKSCRVYVVVCLSFVVRRRPPIRETLQWDNFRNFGATLLGFGTLFTNIILLWIRNFEKNRTTPTPKKNQKTPKKDLWIFTMGYLANALS